MRRFARSVGPDDTPSGDEFDQRQAANGFGCSEVITGVEFDTESVGAL